MSGGFSRPAWRLLLLAVFAMFALSGCGSLLWGPQQAPIVEATIMPVEPASAPVAASEPEPVETETAGPEQPRKPRSRSSSRTRSSRRRPSPHPRRRLHRPRR